MLFKEVQLISAELLGDRKRSAGLNLGFAEPCFYGEVWGGGDGLRVGPALSSVCPLAVAVSQFRVCIL